MKYHGNTPPSEIRLPPPKGYIGETLIKHSIPFLKWERHPNLFNILFERNNYLRIKELYKNSRFDNSKKTILIVSEDAREPICGVPIESLVNSLSGKYNIVLIYIGEYIGNIVELKEAQKSILLKSYANSKYSQHIKFLLKEKNLKYCLVISEALSDKIPLLKRFGINVINIISSASLSPKKHEFLRMSAAFADYQIRFKSIEELLIPCRIPLPSNDKIKIILSESVSLQEIPTTVLKERLIETLEFCLLECKIKNKVINDDANLISASGDFDAGFSLPEAQVQKQFIASEYLRIYSEGIEQRKPKPGFHPGVYAQNNVECLGDPYVHYLKNNRPSGPWLHEVLQPASNTDTNFPYTDKAALHIHAHYIEDLPYLIRRIRKSKIRPHLYISTTSKEAEKKIISMFRFSRMKYEKIQIYPNIGRNIAPLLSGFLPTLHNRYDIIGHIHLKKSLHSGRHAVEDWNNFLLENMIGGKYSMLDQIIKCMLQDDSVGIIYPDDPNIYGWGGNYTFASNLAERMGISINNEGDKFNFPAGSMFWARSASLKALMDLKLQWNDYPEEPVHVDGTMLHALERLFGIIPGTSGYRTVLTNVPGISRILGSY
jgi:hypothetical protein